MKQIISLMLLLFAVNVSFSQQYHLKGNTAFHYNNEIIEGLDADVAVVSVSLDKPERIDVMNTNFIIKKEHVTINKIRLWVRIPELSSILGMELGNVAESAKEKPIVSDPVSGKRYVYGIRGIQELFNVSHPTAQKYKDGIIKDAVFQSGRKIVVDVDKALELFNSRNGR